MIFQDKKFETFQIISASKNQKFEKIEIRKLKKMKKGLKMENGARFWKNVKEQENTKM